MIPPMAILTPAHQKALEQYEAAIGDDQYDQDDVLETVRILRSYLEMTQEAYETMLARQAESLQKMSSSSSPDDPL